MMWQVCAFESETLEKTFDFDFVRDILFLCRAITHSIKYAYIYTLFFVVFEVFLVFFGWVLFGISDKF